MNLKILIINNNGNLNTSNLLKQHRLSPIVITPTYNLGYAGGNNLGINQTTKWGSNYILFLNNDVVVSQDFFKNLMSVFKKQSNLNIGIVGPVIEHKVKNKTFYDYGGYIDWARGQARHINTKKYKISNEKYERDFVSGCCMLVKKELIDKIKGFDSSYFLYLEDVDFCLRAKNAGYLTAINPKVKIFHKGSQSASEIKKIIYSWRNTYKLIFAHWPKKFLFSAIIFNLLFYPVLFIKWQIGHFKRQLITWIYQLLF